MTIEDVIKAHEELENINNEIIQEQQKAIVLLQEQVEYLKSIVNQYNLKNEKTNK
jgi:hypothetical protein